MAKKNGAAKAETTSTQQSVTVGERRISAEFSSSLADCLPGEFVILKQHPKGNQVWVSIRLADGQVLLLASGDMLDAHMKGSKIFDGKPVEGQDCPLREGLRIGIKDKRVQYA